MTLTIRGFVRSPGTTGLTGAAVTVAPGNYLTSIKTGPRAVLKQPGTLYGGTILHQKTLPSKKNEYSRGSTARPVLGPIGTQARTIVV